MKTRKLVFSKYSTLKKVCNLILAQLQWRFLKNTRVRTYPVHLYNWGEPLLNKEIFKMVRYSNESLSMYDYSKKEKKKIKGCRWLWLQSSINWNGSVSPCCAVWHEKFDFGNASDTSFFQIWNSSDYLEARKIARGEKIDSTENICSICYSNKAVI